MRLHVHYR